jgi:hypothetical protein
VPWTFSVEEVVASARLYANDVYRAPKSRLVNVRAI